MSTPSASSPNRRNFANWMVLVLAFAGTLTIRVWGISRHSWMLGDQIRDWSIVLGSFSSLPLIGPPTHVGGYTLGPVFYWVLWVMRVTVGPWFDNLPHAGGIAQAILQSAADTLLLAAIWRRTDSVWLALTATMLIATAAYDLCLSAIVWNPMMGSAFAKIATASVLFAWPQRSTAAAAVTAAIAWAAVQCYTGAIFVALGIFVALLAEPLARHDRRTLKRRALSVAIVVAALQVPQLLHQIGNRFTDSAMGAVTGSLGQVLTGKEHIEITKSWEGLVGAFTFIQLAPFSAPWLVWALIACAVLVAIRHRRDVPLLAVTLLPLVFAIFGYAFYVGDFLDHYYYFSLMPAIVLIGVLAIAAIPSSQLVRMVGIAAFVGTLTIVPSRLAFAATMHRMPEYGILLDGSRKIAKQQQPMRAIRTEFALPPSSSSEFLYTILGGHIDRSSRWIALIKSDGQVVYQQDGGV